MTMSPKLNAEYDCIIVGSGAAGGMAAYNLTKAGVKVLMLEAGRDYDPVKETPMFQNNSNAPLRGVSTPDKPFGYYDATVDGGWTVPNEPYTQAEGTDFQWWRARMLGGRTNHWGRISLRFGEYDFKPFDRDGLGVNWPITYQDVKPYYDKVEELIGVFGSNEGLENTPDSPDGVLHEPPKPRGYELLVKKHCAKLGIPVVPIHKAILTRPINGRSACFYATPCGRGCSIKANFQSTTVLIPPALETGNLDIITNAMVRSVSLDKSGKATGVYYVDKLTGQDVHVKARTVILGASSCSSARILLNSKSTLFPDGLANGSGQVGKNLMDSVGSNLGGHIPIMEDMPPHNEDGVGGEHMYMPWWGYKMQAAKKLDFPRGYHVEFGGGRRMPSMGEGMGLASVGGTYGLKLKEEARRHYGANIGFAGRGEMIPNKDCYCEIDPSVKDKWGIPVLRFHWKWHEHELKQAVHMQKTFAEIIDSLGGKAKPQLDPQKAIMKGGAIIHEVGTTRMGSDAKESVLNQYCQSWEVKNLFVMDGGSFASNPDKNPTLTILALAWRSTDYMIQAFKRKEL